jgi:ribonuclease BN (tRNA processing enzyme)
VIYSTDSEHKLDNMESEAAFEAFFAGADLVICDTMYSLGDTVSLKQDWGHSSNIVAVDLCHAAGARRLALFHHEPTYSDEDIARMHAETIRYAELVRADRPVLEVICAYDGLEIAI